MYSFTYPSLDHYNSPKTYLLTSLYYKTNKIYRTINLSVVTYGCETWSFTLREELKAEGV